mgnify:CR=1 FL=1
MENMEIVFPRLFFTGNRLLGERVENVCRTLGDLRGIFADVDAFSRMPQNILAYEVLPADYISGLLICIREKWETSTS